jgi:hypothetical protein
MALHALYNSDLHYIGDRDLHKVSLNEVSVKLATEELVELFYTGWPTGLQSAEYQLVLENKLPKEELTEIIKEWILV